MNEGVYAGLEICSSVFYGNCLFFAKKLANERFTKKVSNSLIRSFLVSNLSDLLTLLIFGERPEQFAHITHQKRGNELIAHFLK